MMFSWPKQTLLVILVQILDQFVFYGVQLLLTFYLINTIGLDPVYAALFFQFVMLTSVSFTLAGAILADGFLGKLA